MPEEIEYTLDWWKQACAYIRSKADKFPLAPVSGPQLGYYKVQDGRAGPLVPLAIFEHEGRLIAHLGFDPPREVSLSSVWPYCARPDCILLGKDYTAAMAAGAWPSSPAEPLPKATAEAMQLSQLPEQPLGQDPDPIAQDEVAKMTVAPDGGSPGAGHNSGATLDELEALRESLLELVAKYKATHGKRTLITKADADACEDARQDITKARKALDVVRLARNEKPRRLIKLTDDACNPAFGKADGLALELKQKTDAWEAAERARLRVLAAEDARKKAQEVAAAAAQHMPDPEKAATAIVESLLAAPLTIPEPKILLGTEGKGRRRSVKAPETAAIVDLQAAVKYLADMQQAELVALVQKIADRHCKTGALMPGIAMSWTPVQPQKVEDAGAQGTSNVSSNDTLEPQQALNGVDA